MVKERHPTIAETMITHMADGDGPMFRGSADMRARSFGISSSHCFAHIKGHQDRRAAIPSPKEDTHPELSGENGRTRLVVLVAEVGGRWEW